MWKGLMRATQEKAKGSRGFPGKGMILNEVAWRRIFGEQVA